VKFRSDSVEANADILMNGTITAGAGANPPASIDVTGKNYVSITPTSTLGYKFSGEWGQMFCVYNTSGSHEGYIYNSSNEMVGVIPVSSARLIFITSTLKYRIL